MNISLKYITVLVMLSIITFWSPCFAQQNSQYTQYMYNTETINPAYAGNRGMLNLYSFYRTQWVGLDGAPKTQNFSLNTPLGHQGVGLGLSFVLDKIGPSLESSIAVDFSYTIKLSNKAKLSFGLKGGINLLDVNFSNLNYNPTDPLAQDINNRLSPTVGIGLYLHKSDKWYVGLSSPNLLQTEHYNDITVSTASENSHFYLIGGYVFDLNNTIKFKPAILTKAVAGAPLALDLSANFLFNEKLMLGAAYRWNAAVSGLAGFHISDTLMIGYAYDFETTDLGNYNSGSHEIFLRFELITRVRQKVNPRFF